MQNTLTIQDLFTVYKSDIESMEYVNRPLIIRNTTFRAPDGTLRSVLPQHYSSAVFEPDWMILTFAEEQDKKALYNIFHNSGMQVPKIYDKDKMLTIYYGGPKSADYIEEPDVIIDNDIVEINMWRDPSRILSILDTYLEQKRNLLKK